jgi:peptide/nickel transport system permease protein
MSTFILHRLAMLVPVLLVVGTVSFLLVYLTPGDPAAVMLGADATPGQVEQLQEQLGLNDPLHIQYFTWLSGAIRLDFGESIFLDKPVTEAIGDRVVPTAQLTFYALMFVILIGLPAGIVAAVHQNSPVDRLLMIMSVSGAAIPNFFLGILLILLFAVTLRWLPSGGYVEFSEDPVGHFKAMILPAFVLGFTAAALPARLVRSAMLDVMREDYIRTAASKGLASRTITVRHALRNAILPTITVVGVIIADLLGGAVVIETVFTIPGMGQLVVNSIARRDFPVIQGVVVIIALIYLITNLIVDIVYMYIDPRIRYGY